MQRCRSARPSARASTQVHDSNRDETKPGSWDPELETHHIAQIDVTIPDLVSYPHRDLACQHVSVHQHPVASLPSLNQWQALPA
jgi:hypothetical protein